MVLLSAGAGYQKQKDIKRAEKLFRNTLRIILASRGSEDVYAALAHVSLGHTLLLERRLNEAAFHTATGYGVLRKIMPASATYIAIAERDLAAEQNSMHEPEKNQGNL